jgi:hypothetical protein
MKTFHLGCRINTNIPISELQYKIQLYDTVKKSYMPYFNSMQPVSNSKEIHVVFNSPTNLSKEQAEKYRVQIYLYRSRQASVPIFIEHCIHPLSHFHETDGYKKLKPLRAMESKGNTSKQRQGNPPQTDILNISRKQIFVTPEYPAGHQNDPFKKDKIEQQLRIRMAGKSFPNQEFTNLCGPAAYFYCLLKDKPEIYKSTVKNLWETGETHIGALKVKAGNAAKPNNFFNSKGQPRLLGLDWITLGCLRDSKNFLWKYDSPEEFGEASAGITPPHELAEWFRKSWGKGTIDLITYRSSTLQDLLLLNQYIDRGYRVVQLISSPNIFKGATTPNIKSHWIVWEGPVLNVATGKPIDSKSRMTDMIDLNLFTWGWVGNLTTYQKGRHTKNITLKKFLEASFGALVL